MASPSHRRSIGLLILLRLAQDIAEWLANADLLASLDEELELLGALEHKHDRAAEAEATHLLGLEQWLPVEDGRRRVVHSFCVRAERMFPA